jgi:manganese/zinc/iron transport system permease protein
MSLLHDLIFDYTLRMVALGSAVLGIVAGSLGAFAVLRRQSLLGDAVSHAALPGIVLAFLITGHKTPLVLVVGAGCAGWAAALLVMAVVRTTRIKSDAALGIVLSAFFGFGLVLLSFVQRSSSADHAGLNVFLFGQAAALVGSDLVTMATLGLAVLLVLVVLWKEFKLLAFDPDFAEAIGLPVRGLDVVLTTLLVVAIVVGLQTVGVVLMSAMIVAPAAAARQWTDRLGRLVVLAGLFGGLAGLTGAVISASVPRLPTGPTIILVITAIAGGSLFFAPRRGLIAARLRTLRQRRRLQGDAVLADLFRLAAQHRAPETAPHAESVLRAMSARPGVRRTLRDLGEKGLVQRDADGRWRLTLAGVATGRHLVEERGRGPASPDPGAALEPPPAGEVRP